MRRGFTLIELLVATGVFLFGFTAAFAMFLAGTRARAQADGILRLSLASSSLVEEFRLEAGRESLANGSPAPGIPFAPSDYIGDGFAFVDSTNESTADINAPLFRYPLQPGVWYRVIDCVDEKGSSSDTRATALQLDLLVVWNPLPDDTLTIAELAGRQRIDRMTEYQALTDDAAKVSFIADFLAKRGFAVRERAVIIRRASWER